MILSERKAELVEANARVRELDPDARVRYDGTKPRERRWQVWTTARLTFLDATPKQDAPGTWKPLTPREQEEADARAKAEQKREADAVANSFGTEALICSGATWPEAGEKFFEWTQDKDRHAFHRDRLLRGEALDVEVPESPAQKARREEREHKMRVAKQEQGEILKRQLRYVLQKEGLYNVGAIQKLLKRI